MPELRLYFFDPREGENQDRRVKAIRKVLENKNYGDVTDWGENSVAPHFYLTLRIREPFTHDVSETPALSFITKIMRESGSSQDVCRASRTIISEFFPFQRNGDLEDLSITLPDGKTLRSSSGEKPSLIFNNRNVVGCDATSDEVTTLETLQALEYRADFRVKFASIDDSEWRYVSDADEEYQSFFVDLPAPWQFEEKPLEIYTRYEHNRTAWALSHERTTVAAVKHETGLELLFGKILEALVGAAAVDACVKLIHWGYHKWIRRRRDLVASGISKSPTFIEMERIKRNAEGQVVTAGRLTFRGDVQQEVLKGAIERLFGD